MENPQTPARILVVDDEPDIRNILHILLSSRGYAVDEAENGLRTCAAILKLLGGEFVTHRDGDAFTAEFTLPVAPPDAAQSET